MWRTVLYWFLWAHIPVVALLVIGFILAYLHVRKPWDFVYTLKEFDARFNPESDLTRWKGKLPPVFLNGW